MNVIILKGTVADGKRFSPNKENKPVTVSDKAGRLLCGYGHAVPIENRESEMEAETRGRRGKK